MNSGSMLPQSQMMHQANRGFTNNAAAVNMRRMNQQQQHMPNSGKLYIQSDYSILTKWKIKFVYCFVDIQVL